ncbi:hypothetical protein NPIL_157961 [Nephila pilipes]|uniref:Uncharacterized protein n=1 Tax=Nephila pilipes TaxID=299642 RepID=A0A8X6QLV5_NEPPI|nr:hypothetical protein NPIL_157961 [Nephila pilipes]
MESNALWKRKVASKANAGFVGEMHLEYLWLKKRRGGLYKERALMWVGEFKECDVQSLPNPNIYGAVLLNSFGIYLMSPYEKENTVVFGLMRKHKDKQYMGMRC